MCKKVKLGILGLGNMGTRHAKQICEGNCPEIALTAVCDTNTDRLEWVKNSLSENIACFERAEDMLDSGLIDALLVAVPHYDHPKYAIMAMKRGLHVMVEKPAGVYTKQVLEMNAVADECGVVFALMMNQRTNCVYRKMREIIQSGELGAIRRTSWIITSWYRPQAYFDSGDWRATWSGEGGGVLMNQAPHNIDLWQWICGLPTKVYTKMHFGKWHDIEVEDDVTTYVEYENGATGVFITSTGDDPGTNRFEIVCEKGKLVADISSLSMWKSDVSEPEFSNSNQDPHGKRTFEFIENVETDGFNPKHNGVLNAFAGAILHGTPLVADGREGLDALTLANAMYLSAWTGKEIELKSFNHDLYYEELMKRVKTSRRKTTVTEAVVYDLNDTFGS